MRVGEKARVTMSSDYAYGKNGYLSWGIPPHADLVYDIELLRIG